VTATETGSTAALLERVLSYCTAEHAEVSYSEVREASTRFANNAITQNVSKRTGMVTVKAAFGQRVGKASVTDFSESGLRGCATQAEAIARATEPDPEFLPPPEAQSYPSVEGYDERVAEATPEDRAAAIRQATEIARAASLESAGSYATNAYRQALANSAGLYHEQSLTDTHFTITAMAGDSSGWSRTTGYRLDDADPGRCATIAAEKALAAGGPQEIPPGEYTLILEPAAVADFFGFLGWAMDAKAAHEGRSAFTGKEGQRIGPPGVTLSTQPDHPDVPCFAASEDGLPLPSTTWVEDGVLNTLSYGRFWAQKTGHAFTGRPANLIMEGGDESLEELIASVERGVLVTRFWYIRFVDPMKLLLTGMTRDGLYRIEDGQVIHGLKNMRFNDSPLESLNRIVQLGPQARAGRSGTAYVPALRLEGFRFTSGTSF
jgi:predicted Zn-dependent protease